VRFGVQCCLRRPGRGEMIVTGNAPAAMVDCATVAKDCVARSMAIIEERLGLERRSEEAGLRLIPPLCDLHVHVDNAWEPASNRHYSSAFLVAMVSLMLRRRPVEDVGIIGHIVPDGLLFELSVPGGGEAWTDEGVASCFLQGFRRLIISDDTVRGPVSCICRCLSSLMIASLRATHCSLTLAGALRKAEAI
jgi:hypothetical protein